MGLIRGHSSWWLADIFLECYRPERFDSYKCWKIIKEHQIKKEKKPKQISLL